LGTGLDDIQLFRVLIGRGWSSACWRANERMKNLTLEDKMKKVLQLLFVLQAGRN